MYLGMLHWPCVDCRRTGQHSDVVICRSALSNSPFIDVVLTLAQSPPALQTAPCSCRLVTSCSLSMGSPHRASLMPRRWRGFELEAPAFVSHFNGLKRWMAVGVRRLEHTRGQVRGWISQRREAGREQKGEGEARRVEKLHPVERGLAVSVGVPNYWSSVWIGLYRFHKVWDREGTHPRVRTSERMLLRPWEKRVPG